MPRILVTGAAGFVGTHLVPALAARGAEVLALWHRTPPATAEHPAVRWHRCDLATDALDFTGTDHVVHLAAVFSPAAAPEAVERMRLANEVATARVAEAACRSGARLVHVSSIAACGEPPSPARVDETCEWPATAYGESKRSGERAVLAWGGRGLSATILRPTALFGEWHGGSVLELARVLQRRRFLMIGDGTNATNFYYVKDFVAAILAALDRPAAGRTYLAADDPLSLAELVAEMARHLGIPVPRGRLPLSLAMAAGHACDVVAGLSGRDLPLSARRVRAMTQDVRYSNRRLKEELGDCFPYGVREGLARTLAWYRSGADRTPAP